MTSYSSSIVNNNNTAVESEPLWFQTICQELEERDAHQRYPFESISDSFEFILTENVELSLRVNELSQAIMQMKQEKWNKSPSSTLDLSVNTASSSNINSMKMETENLKETLEKVYQLKTENEVALSKLKKQSIEHEELILLQTQSLDEFARKHSILQRNFDECQESYHYKHRTHYLSFYCFSTQKHR